MSDFITVPTFKHSFEMTFSSVDRPIGVQLVDWPIGVQLVILVIFRFLLAHLGHRLTM